ncbi:Potassium voltage-gated channel subfamily H member 5 [Triplophysa tibetana]|uniref:Potassium voltage-gated channel subfamily H member 5 n=1 Tax=Triplophysa tibetana TaxID=1572043 RepID=A0A5A9NFF4_9TELE|nr:Potassium voltage-gated channel subfamily H member 5 [Triplophysa tibetana]
MIFFIPPIDTHPACITLTTSFQQVREPDRLCPIAECTEEKEDWWHHKTLFWKILFVAQVRRRARKLPHPGFQPCLPRLGFQHCLAWPPDQPAPPRSASAPGPALTTRPASASQSLFWTTAQSRLATTAQSRLGTTAHSRLFLGASGIRSEGGGSVTILAVFSPW